MVTGEPSSGNRLLYRMVQHQGFIQDSECLMMHSAQPRCHIDKMLAAHALEDCRVLYILRDPLMHKRSVKARWPRGYLGKSPMQMAIDQHKPSLLAFVGIPSMSVLYEDLVREPYAWGKRIADFLGVEWRGWGEAVVDGDEKHR